MNLYEYIGSQFANPRGMTGKICCLLMNTMNRSMYNNTAHSLTLTPKSTVLDIGYGNGYLIHKLYKKRTASFYGIDISEDARKNAVHKNKKGIQKKRIHLSLGDCCNMMYQDDFFDAVVTVNTIYFWENTAKGLAEIHRVLKSGGIFSNAFYTKEFLTKLKYTEKGFQFFEPAQLKALAQKAGFTQLSFKRISHGNGFLMVCRK